MQDKNMSIIQHLEELRKAIIISLISLVPAAIVGWVFRERVLAILLKPATDKGVKLIYLTPTEPFFVMLKVAIFSGILVASPVILWQLWSFILPAFEKRTRRMIGFLVPISLLLFLTGIFFGYYTVFRFGINFFIDFASSSKVVDLNPTFKLGDYLSFAISFLLPFGVIFEVPLVALVLARIGLISSRFLSSKRKYAILIIFVLAAIITPTPDIFTQSMVAGPMYVLYEVSILVTYLAGRKRQKQLIAAEKEAEGN